MQEHDTDPGPGDQKARPTEQLPPLEERRQAPLVHPAAPQVRHVRNSQPPQSTYETDFYAWTQAQSAAIRAKDLAALDVDHLAEEIEDLGRNNQHAITRQLQRLLAHLLKWRYQPTHRAPSWDTTIDQAREAIADVIEDNPSLRNYPAQRLPLAYRRARRQAAKETGFPLATFPELCPWTLAELHDEDFFPEA